MAKEADRPSPKMVRGLDHPNPVGVTTSNMPTGVQTPTVPDIVFFIDNWVSPMFPTKVVSRP